MSLLVALVVSIALSVTLEPPFGEAEARALTLSNGITVDISVKVEGEPTAVLARVTGLAGELPPQALVDRGGGTWGTILQLTNREDVAVAFEYLDAEGATTISPSTRLSELGVKEVAINTNLPTAPPVEEPGVSPWLLAAMAAGLGALVLMGFWASGGLGDLKVSDWTFAAAGGASDAAADGGVPQAPNDEEPATADEAVG